MLLTVVDHHQAGIVRKNRKNGDRSIFPCFALLSTLHAEKIDLSPFFLFLLDSLRSTSGAVAQLGERRVRNAKVESSILFGSTKFTVSFHRPGSSAG